MKNAKIGDLYSVKLEIVTDDDPQNPRKEYDNFGTILYTSSRYTLGDKQVSGEEIEEIVNDPEMISLPVYAYIHGGIALSCGGFSCPWDSGQCGIIYISRERAREEFGEKPLEFLHNLLESEIKTFGQYLSGEVYGYVVTRGDGEQLDSCFGYYGREDAETDGKSTAAYWAKKLSEERDTAIAEELAERNTTQASAV
jgi:hypothetical protein